MVTNNVRFGELETRALFALEEAEAGLVTSAEIARMLKISANRANKLAWQLAKKKRLIRIRKGIYLFAPLKAGQKGYWSEEALALIAQMLDDKPYYIGFWTALNYYGLTEQIPWVTQVVVLHRQRSFEAAGTKFEFIKVNKLGEWREEKVAGKAIKIATVEQLIIDCLSHTGCCGGVVEVTKALWNARKRINWKKLEKNALQSSDAVRRRLGFLLETLGLPSLKIKGKLVSWRWLDPSKTKQAIEKSVDWGLLLNVSRKELTEWKES